MGGTNQGDDAVSEFIANKHSFLYWLKSNAMVVTVATAIGTAISALPYIDRFSRVLNVDSTNVIEAVVVVVALIWTYSTKRARQRSAAIFSAESQETVNQFSAAWLIVMLVWFSEYVGYSVQYGMRSIAPVGAEHGQASGLPGFVMTFVTLLEAASILIAPCLQAPGACLATFSRTRRYSRFFLRRPLIPAAPDRWC